MIVRHACSDEADIGFPNLSKDSCKAFSDVFILIVAAGSFLLQPLEQRQLLHDLHVMYAIYAADKMVQRCKSKDAPSKTCMLDHGRAGTRVTTWAQALTGHGDRTGAGKLTEGTMMLTTGSMLDSGWPPADVQYTSSTIASTASSKALSEAKPSSAAASSGCCARLALCSEAASPSFSHSANATSTFAAAGVAPAHDAPQSGLVAAATDPGCSSHRPHLMCRQDALACQKTEQLQQCRAVPQSACKAVWQDCQAVRLAGGLLQEGRQQL